MQKYDTLDAYWHDIHDIPLLSEEEECCLAERIHAGDESAVEKLVTSNLRYVVSIARQYAEKSDEVSMDDLISEGNIALITAARKWQPEKEKSFVNYAQFDIKKAMLQAMPAQGTMVTLPKRNAESAKQIRRYSTDAPIHAGQTNTFGDLLKAGKPMTDDSAEDNDIGYALAKVLRYLDEKDKYIIKSFYGIGTADVKTMAEIGEELGLKRERVRQIRKKAERKMRRLLKTLN
ncbi:MAG: sigma-70 family RNA polymerase sigma factor [Prevotella sp.]|nr:sigma-70 family RNA polymerase sigma factor [Prevotella sp.]